MSEIVTVGLAPAKNVFQVHRADAFGRGVLLKKLRRDTEPYLHHQAGLDARVAVDGLSPALAGRLCRPNHFKIEPDRQRSAALGRLVIRGPVPGQFSVLQVGLFGLVMASTCSAGFTR